jgi:hypothetical protein
MNLFIILMIVTMLFVLVMIYLVARNDAVYKFRLKMIDEDFASYLKLPKYTKMVYSFKRLKKENWIKDDKKS